MDNLNNPLSAILVSVFLVGSVTAFGRKLISLLKIKTDSALESLLFGAALGLGILGYVVLSVGLLQLLRWEILLTIIALIVLFSLKEISQLLRKVFSRLKKREPKRKAKVASVLIAISTISLGILALIQALSPPAGLDWDGLAYHLAVPKLYISKHGIYYIPFISHSNFPFLTEMWYTLGLAVGSTIIAKLFHFWMYIATAISIYSLGRKHISPLTGSIGALLFMSTPVVFWEAGVAYADITTALYLTLAAYAFLNWETSLSTKWLVICGLMGSFALSTKVIALIPLAVLCFWVLIKSLRADGVLKALRYLFLMGAIILVAGSPWYIKSYIYTGNPVYPFLYNIFGGKYWSQAAAEAYRSSQLAFGMGRGLKELLMLPWNISIHGYHFFDSPQFIGLLGIAFIGLIPLYFITNKRYKSLPLLGTTAGLFIVAWFFLMQQSRYLIGILPMLAIIAGAVVQSANEEWRFGRYAVNLFVAISVIPTIIVGYLLAQQTIPVLLGHRSEKEYLASSLDVYPAESWINEFVPENEGIVLLDEVRGFYLDRKYIWGNPGHHEVIPWQTFTNGSDMVNWFRAHGYTYILINWRFAPSNTHKTKDFLHNKLLTNAIGNGLMQEVFARYNVSVYKLVEE